MRCACAATVDSLPLLTIRVPSPHTPLRPLPLSRCTQWETGAIKKELRGQVANELYPPALLRRLLRKWASLPSLQQHERAIEVASEQMKMHIYGGFTISRWKGFVEWRRSRRGFFKLLLGAWRHWAKSHKHAGAVAHAAASRHKMMAMAQHFEILQQHTAYRRRLNAATTVKLQKAQGDAGSARAPGAVARRLAFMLASAEAEGLVGAVFRAWCWLCKGKRALGRFRVRLLDAHNRTLLEMIFVRWLITARGEKAEAAQQQKLVGRWQKATAAFGWPLPAAKMREVHAMAATPSQQDLADAASAALAAKTASAVADPRAAAAAGGAGSEAPPNADATAQGAAAASAPGAPAGDGDKPVKHPKGSTEIGRLEQMPSILMWQSLASIAPAVLREQRDAMRKLELPTLERMRDKRDEAHWALPKFGFRRAVLLGFQGLMEARAADKLRKKRARDARLLLQKQSEDSAVIINSINQSFTLVDRNRGAAAELERSGSAGKKRGGSASARGRSKGGKRPGSGKGRSRTPPPMPMRAAADDESGDEYAEEAPVDALGHLPPSVPRTCRGRPRPPELPILPWELSERDRIQLEEAQRKTDPGLENVAALSALRALASENIASDDHTTSGLADQVFNTELASALDEEWEGQRRTAQGALGLSQALADASTRTSDVARRTRAASGEELGGLTEAEDEADDDDDDDDGASDEGGGEENDEEEAEEKAEEEAAASEPHEGGEEGASAQSRRTSFEAAAAGGGGLAPPPPVDVGDSDARAEVPASAASASAASGAAIASVRLLMGATAKHFLPVEQLPTVSADEVKRQVLEGYQKARASLGSWAEEQELEELSRLRAKCQALGLSTDETLLYEGVAEASPPAAAAVPASEPSAPPPQAPPPVKDVTDAGGGMAAAMSDSPRGPSAAAPAASGTESINRSAWEALPAVAPEWEAPPSLVEAAKPRR